MRERSHVMCPQVELCEQRSLLAGGVVPQSPAGLAGIMSPVAGPVVEPPSELAGPNSPGTGSTAQPTSGSAPNQPVILILGGTFRGHFHAGSSLPDTGTPFVFQGHGRTQDFGRALLTGQIQSVGFIAGGRAHGALSLSGSAGTLTLNLTGAVAQNGPKGLPEKFTFTTEHATGLYTNVAPTGTATLVLKTAAGKHEHGTFTLVVSST